MVFHEIRHKSDHDGHREWGGRAVTMSRDDTFNREDAASKGSRVREQETGWWRGETDPPPPSWKRDRGSVTFFGGGVSDMILRAKRTSLTPLTDCTKVHDSTSPARYSIADIAALVGPACVALRATPTVVGTL